MRKKLLLILLSLITLTGCTTTKNTELSENFYLYEKNNEEYNIYIKSFEGEYHKEFPTEIIEDLQLNRNWEKYADFEGMYLYTQEEYKKYCEKFNLEQKYTDNSKKYIVLSSVTTGWYAGCELVDIIIKDNNATVYILEEKLGMTTGDVDAFTIVVPVDKNIEKINYEIVNTKEYIDTEIEYDPYLQVEDKPVIYLYPEKTTNVSVNLDYKGTLTCTYPKYNNGWKVIANPDGTIIYNNQEYNYLFWEGIINTKYDFSTGFCVKGEDTSKFLEEKLEELGLTRKEANEFIVYWLPRMQNNKYNVISFQTNNYTENAKLEISPQPDTTIRVFMAYYASNEKVEINEQKLITPLRKGFTVVEWGGCEVK